MSWAVEQDVLFLLLHSLGKLPSLEGALDLEAQEEVPLQRLRQRAQELGAATLADGELRVDPALRPLLERASDAAAWVELIVEPRRDESPMVRYYYLCSDDLVVVEWNDAGLLVRAADSAPATDEITALIGVSEDQPAQEAIAVPAFEEHAYADGPLPWEDLRTLDDWFSRSRAAWLLSVSEGQIQSTEVIVTQQGHGWVLQQDGARQLSFQPISPAEVRSKVGQLLRASERTGSGD